MLNDCLYIFREMSICQLSNWVFLFCCWIVGVLYIFWTPISWKIHDLQIFSPTLHIVFSLVDNVLWCTKIWICWSPMYLLFTFLACASKIFFNVHLFLRVRERERERERKASRGRAEREGDTESKADSRLWVVSTEPGHGARTHKLWNHDLPQVEHLTNWATQASLCFWF